MGNSQLFKTQTTFTQPIKIIRKPKILQMQPINQNVDYEVLQKIFGKDYINTKRAICGDTQSQLYTSDIKTFIQYFNKKTDIDDEEESQNYPNYDEKIMVLQKQIQGIRKMLVKENQNNRVDSPIKTQVDEESIVRQLKARNQTKYFKLRDN